MQKHVLAVVAAAFMLGYGPTAATAQGPMMGQSAQPQTQEAPGASGGGWGYGRWHHMMRGGFTGGPGMSGHPMMMRMIFALMDTDGDGTIELQEFQAAHERILRRWTVTRMAASRWRSWKPSCTEQRQPPRRRLQDSAYLRT